MKKSILTILLSTAFISISVAQESGGTSISHTSINSQNIEEPTTASKHEKATFWGLDNEEWDRYEKYMDIEGKLFYKNLSPLNVMALIESNREKRNIYIAKHVTKERQRVQNEVKLANDAWRIQTAMYGPEELMNFNTLPWSDGNFDERTITLNPNQTISAEDMQVPAYYNKSDMEFQEGDSIMLVFNPMDCKKGPQVCLDQVKMMVEEQPLKIILMLTENNEDSYNDFAEAVNLSAYDPSKTYVEYLDNNGYFFEKDPSHNDVYQVRAGTILRKL